MFKLRSPRTASEQPSSSVNLILEGAALRDVDECARRGHMAVDLFVDQALSLAVYTSEVMAKGGTIEITERMPNGKPRVLNVEGITTQRRLLRFWK